MALGRGRQVRVQGKTPHDSAVSSTRPNLVGLEARTTNPTAVADGDVVRAMGDDLGKTIAWASCPRDLITTHYVSCSVSTTITFATDPGASVFRDILYFSVELSASKTPIIQIYDKTLTGTKMFEIKMVADGAHPRTFGTFSPPFPAAAAGTGWGIDTDESSTFVVNGTMQCADSV